MPTPPVSSPTTPTTTPIHMASGDQDPVETRQNSIKAKYGQLQQLAKERRQMLEDSKKRFNLLREIIELEHWINDKEALASAEEPSKDLDHVEMLMKKFDDFQKDIATNEARLEHIEDLAGEMIDAGHPDADEIQRLCEVSVATTCSNGAVTRLAKCVLVCDIEMIMKLVQGLNQHWDDLTEVAKKKKNALDGSHQVQKFIR